MLLAKSAKPAAPIFDDDYGMKRMNVKYTLLAGSLISFAASACGVSPDLISNLGMPLGLIFFGLFLIVLVLEKEMALYDQENRAVAHVKPSPAPARVPRQSDYRESTGQSA